MTVLTSNCDIIKRRWPDIGRSMEAAPAPEVVTLTRNTPQPTLFIDGIHISSGYDQGREAELQATLIPEESAQAWVYGVGTGQLPRVLLRRRQMKRLTVVVLNQAVAVESFRHFDHSDWLSDTRVKLTLGENETDVHFPFAAVPSCLELAAEATARLRDCVFLELATPFIRKRHGAKNTELARRLEQNRNYILTDGDAAGLFNSYPGSTVIIAAAGPTLSMHYGWISEKRKDFPLIAVDAALRPLAATGITPDIVVSIDAAPKGVNFFEAIDLSRLRDKDLVYFPVVHEDVLTRWPGKRLTAYADHPLYHPFMETQPKGTLFSSGSVLHPSVDLAVKMGASRIVLLGADLSFPGNKSHADGCPRNYLFNDSGMKKHWVLNGRGERVPSNASMRGFLRDLERYIVNHPEVQFINGSREGAHIKGAEYLEDLQI